MEKRLQCILIWLVVAGTSHASNCAYNFTFPTLRDSVLKVQQNTKIALPFIYKSACGFTDKFRITVAKRDRQTPIFATICLITVANNTCHASNHYCKCTDRKGEYELRKTAEITDNTTWAWWKGRGGKHRKEVDFYIVPSSGDNTSDDPTAAVVGSVTALLLVSVAVFISYKLCLGKLGWIIRIVTPDAVLPCTCPIMLCQCRGKDQKENEGSASGSQEHGEVPEMEMDVLDESDNADEEVMAANQELSAGGSTQRGVPRVSSDYDDVSPRTSVRTSLPPDAQAPTPGDYTFNFPTLHGSVIFAKENVPITVPFNFLSTCGATGNFTIKVGKRSGHYGIIVTVCMIVQTDGNCQPSTDNCKCLQNKGKYKLTKLATLDDNTTWIWWKDKEKDRGQKVVFYVKADDVLPVSTAEPDDSSKLTTSSDVSDSKHDTQILVFGAAGILAVAATIIAIVIVRTCKRQPADLPVVQFRQEAGSSTERQAQRQVDDDTPNNSAYSTIRRVPNLRKEQKEEPVHHFPAPGPCEMYENTPCGDSNSIPDGYEYVADPMRRNKQPYTPLCEDELYENEDPLMP